MTDGVEPSRRWYDRDGRPIPPEEAERLLGRPGYDRIRATTVMDMADLDWIRDISTVWVGVDLGEVAEPPLIFETAVFDRDHTTLRHRRYATEAQASEAHEAFVVAACEEANDPVVLETTDSVT
ncbi:hypothetical protein DEU38_10119 [Rhodococcus sp. AG1013]|uniref:hypothetical protein n=1 Tax=Rhodococcus sp. AG1013 TaxID=2183996 RepID=UPI000E09E264|nr:hypothetical protein [Rhodococcus sp. AG1013]RDI35543.1 hypothetical protein DEU38_10119 [Rhodococcus sp. AG1013]